MPLKDRLVNNVIARLIIKVYNHFDTIPEAISIENYRFYIISNIAYTLGWFIHLLWLFVFLSIGQYTMMNFQFLSIGYHVLAIYLNRKGIHQAAMIIGMLEVVGHQVLAVYLLGWGAGFQYIIAAITLFPFLKPDGSLVVKALLFISCVASFLLLEIYVKNQQPVYTLSAAAVNGFNYSNIILCFLFMATWGFFVNIATQRTEEVLVKKKQELFIAEKAAEQTEMQRQLEVKQRDNEIYRLRNVELKNSNDEIILRNKMIEEEKKKSEDLLLNILPEETARELLREGHAKSHKYDLATVMFTDFVGFTVMAEKMEAEELVKHIDTHFRAFDEIVLRNGVEKIKTIGDAYMCAGGIPVTNSTHPFDVVHAALDIQRYMNSNESGHFFEIRIGIHTGPLVAGVVGKHKFQYDIWGDAVNIAARMEQNSVPGKVNISGATYELIKDTFDCDYRGKINAKHKGEMDMYFVNGKPGSYDTRAGA
jgi:class 3 adenylate cyclase